MQELQLLIELFGVSCYAYLSSFPNLIELIYGPTLASLDALLESFFSRLIFVDASHGRTINMTYTLAKLF